MATIRQILKLVFFTSKTSQDYKDVKELGTKKGRFKNNIHDIKNLKKYSAKWLSVHFVFKYRILLPALMILDRFFGKIKIKKIPNNPHNYLVKRFDKAFENALRDWFKYYVQGGKCNGKNKGVITKEFNKSGSVERIRSLKDWFITVLLMDQAYKEFLNMFMFSLAKEMQKEFKGKRANHLVYNAKIVDEVNYFRLFEQIRKDLTIGVHDQSENTKRKQS